MTARRATRSTATVPALQRRVRALEAQLRASDEFLSVVAHELRNPIAPAYLELQALVDRLDESPRRSIPPAALRRQLGSLRRKLDRFVAVLDRLADLSRVGVGLLEHRVDEVDLSAVTRDVALGLRRELVLSGSRLRLRAGRKLVGSWDRLRLEQIIGNLLSNAIRYGAGKPIDVSVSARGSHAVLTVRDRGVGIAPGDRARVFERFGRTAEGRRAGGLGIGLWIVKQLCAATGGAISVESRPGRGSRFTVILPRGPRLKR